MTVGEKTSPARRGGWAEDLAQGFLQRKGLALLARNYRCRFGEIDLIMQERDTMVFVEVRYRARTDFGCGAESVDWRKQRKLVATARHYLRSHSRGSSIPVCRFDVVALSSVGQSPTVSWIRNAFEASW